MGAIAKKAIGIMATAAATRIVKTLIEKARVESLHRTKTAKDPIRSRRPIAETSTIRNRRILLRRRRESEFWPVSG